jgi:hypothetical protein
MVKPIASPRTIRCLTTELDHANAARDAAARFGYDLHPWFPKEGLPSADILIMILDETMLNAHGRRDCLAWLQTQARPPEPVTCSRDFHLGTQEVIRPGLMLASRLDDNVFRALRDGHLLARRSAA